MKVLHLFDVYLPSTLSWVAQLLDGLEAVEVEVGAPWIVRSEFFNPKFRHHFFPLQQWLFPNTETEFDHHFGQKIFTAAQRRLPLYSFWLEKMLKNDPPDILHAHFGPTGCLYLPLAKKIRRPLAVTFYGFDYTKLPRLHPVYRRKYEELFAQTTKIIAASETGRAKLESMGCPPEKLAVVPPSPRIESFPFVRRTKSVGQLRLVQVSTFTPKKGHLTTLEAFRLALDRCPEMHLTLAGELQDKALVQQLRSYIATHRLEEKVTWLDFVAHGDMAEFLKQYDIFIHPSCHAPDGDHEDSPVVLLEAQASGLPVISTTHFNIPAEVLHDHTGLLAPENDPVALAECIRRFYLMENSAYQQFSENARRHIEQHFNVKNSARLLRALYEEIHLSSFFP